MNGIQDCLKSESAQSVNPLIGIERGVPVIKTCECGCQQEFEVNKRWKYRGFAQRFISGHNLSLTETREKCNSSIRTPEYRNKLKEICKLRYLNGGHIPSRKGLPSPMKGKCLTDEQKEKLRLINLGRRHTDETKEKCRKIAMQKGYGLWMLGKKQTAETKKKISDSHVGIMPANRNVPGKYGNIKRGWFDIGGKDMFFRSTWEANYAIYLNFLIKHGEIREWSYEADTFIFDKIQFGTRSYKPDFKIVNNDNTIEYHEVKGRMDTKSLTKFKRMGKYYPTIKIVIIDGTSYRKLKSDMGKMLKFF